MVNRHSFILIRQMAALARRALADVCTVPVLLVVWSSGRASVFGRCPFAVLRSTCS